MREGSPVEAHPSRPSPALRGKEKKAFRRLRGKGWVVLRAANVGGSY
jgi:hypothetical protein